MGYAGLQVSAEPQETSRSFGPYELLSLIARGGMGEVYLASLRGELGFEKKLVVKTIRPELAENPKFVELFAAEAKTAVTLTHGNIVPIYELGRSDETLYIAMGYVDGPSLSQLLRKHSARKNALDPATALFIVREVLTGLAYAHTRHNDRPPVVHRDISPRNILVDRSGQVRIVDFGIALAADVQAAHSAGSTGYMAPEQARAAKADPSADVFSVGCVLYELLTLRKAFPSEGIWMAPDLEPVPKPVRPLLEAALSSKASERPEDAGAMLKRLGPLVAQLAPTYTTQDLSEHIREFFPAGWAHDEAGDVASGTPATPATAHTQTFATRLTAVKDLPPPEGPEDPDAAPPATDSDGTAAPIGEPSPTSPEQPRRGIGMLPLLGVVALAVGGTWIALSGTDTRPAPAEESADGAQPASTALPPETAATNEPEPAMDPPATPDPMEITIEPADAKVAITLAGKPVNGPPYLVPIPSETLEGVITAPGFRDLDFEVSPNDEGRPFMRIKLAPKQKGYLDVVAPNVSYAIVKVDGEKLGKHTPIKRHELEEGDHRVVVVCPAEVCGNQRTIGSGTVSIRAKKTRRFEAPGK